MRWIEELETRESGENKKLNFNQNEKRMMSKPYKQMIPHYS